MNDKERLEEIKKKCSEVTVLGYIDDIEIVGVDMKDLVWLIQYVEELEIKLSINTNNMKQLQKENERYKQTLEFYANKKNHEREWDTFTDSGVKESEVMKDGGEKARQALKGETK